MLQNFYNFSLSSVTFPFFFYNLYLNEVFIKCTTGLFFRNIDIRFLIFYLNKTKSFGNTDKCSCQIRFFPFIFSPLFFFLSLFLYLVSELFPLTHYFLFLRFLLHLLLYLYYFPYCLLHHIVVWQQYNFSGL